MLLLLLAVDFGRLFFSYVQINNAAREAAAYAATAPTDNTAILAKARLETNSQAQRGEGTVTTTTSCINAAGTTIPCSTSSAGAGAGSQIKVTASENFTFLTPFIGGFFGNPFTISASASSTVLAYAAVDVGDATTGNMRRAGPELHRHRDGPVGLRGPERLDTEQRHLQHLRLQLGLG